MRPLQRCALHRALMIGVGGFVAANVTLLIQLALGR